jgi:hypothetical protein
MHPYLYGAPTASPGPVYMPSSSPYVLAGPPPGPPHAPIYAGYGYPLPYLTAPANAAAAMAHYAGAAAATPRRVPLPAPRPLPAPTAAALAPLSATSTPAAADDRTKSESDSDDGDASGTSSSGSSSGSSSNGNSNGKSPSMPASSASPPPASVTGIASGELMVTSSGQGVIGPAGRAPHRGALIALWVGNLPDDVTNNDLVALFEGHDYAVRGFTCPCTPRHTEIGRATPYRTCIQREREMYRMVCMLD